MPLAIPIGRSMLRRRATRRKLKFGRAGFTLSYVSSSTCRDRMGRWFYRRSSTVQSFLGSEHRACGPSSAQCVSRAAAGLQAQTNCPCTCVLVRKGSTTSYCTAYVATGGSWMGFHLYTRTDTDRIENKQRQTMYPRISPNKK